MEELSDINKLILKNRILDIQKKKGHIPVYIIEFGSGFLTDFIIEIQQTCNINIVIDTFTSLNSSYTNDNRDCHIFKKQLLTCSESSYNKLFSSRKYIKNYMVKSQQNPNKKTYNAFYDINPTDLRDKYDIAILAEPNGNGKDIGFLHIKDKMEIGGFILLNYLDRYTSLEEMDLFFDTKTAFMNIVYGNRIGFYKIINIKN